MIASLACLMVFTGCGKATENGNGVIKTSGKETIGNNFEGTFEEAVKEKTIIGADGQLMPGDGSVYQPAEGEHRFETILNEIASTKTFTMTQFRDKTRTYAYDSATGTYVAPFGYVWSYTETGFHINGQNAAPASQLEFISTIIYLKNGDNYLTRFIDPVNKNYLYNFVDASSNASGNRVDYEDGFFAYPDEPSSRALPNPIIPAVLSPDNWEYDSSETVEINGVNYYSETYNYKRSNIVCKITVIIDGDGNAVMMGDVSNLPNMFAEDDETGTFYLREQEYQYDPDYNGKDIAGEWLEPKETLSAYGHYGFISVSSMFDSNKYNMNNYKSLDSIYEFMDRQNVNGEREKEIREELGL